MGGNKYGDLILEAIDQLRKRKARPDLERICHLLERRHGLKSAEVNEQLADMVDRGIVMKVDYKGNTSYRNAAKWDKAKATQEVGSLKWNVKVKQEYESDEDIAKSTEIQELENSKRNIKVKQEYRSNIECNKFIGCPNSFKDTRELRCNYCLLLPGVNCNGGEPEGLLVCKDCNVKAHPACVDYSGEAAKRVMLSVWQCPECKICSICSECSDGDNMLICIQCDKGFHINCHNPPITVKPKILGKWKCIDCVTSDFFCKCDPNSAGMSSSQDTNSLVPTSYAEASKEQAAAAFVFQKCLENYPEVVPVVDSWTVKEVAVFIKYIGFPKEASVFKEQEIDGQSLLLMKRSDVLTGLSFKLGPALKIYSHIKRLQNVNTSSVPSVWYPD